MHSPIAAIVCYSHILSMWSLGFQLPWSPWLKTAKLRSSEWCSYGTPVGRWVSNWQLGLDVGGPSGYDILRPMDTDFMVQCVGEKAWCLNMLRSKGYSGYSLSLLVGVAVSHKNSLRELWRPSEAARARGQRPAFPGLIVGWGYERIHESDRDRRKFHTLLARLIQHKLFLFTNEIKDTFLVWGWAQVLNTCIFLHSCSSNALI